MIRVYDKGNKVPLSEHFKSTEFDCPCARPTCRFTAVDEELIHLLELLREQTGALKINSGFRCNAHNAEVGGANESRHPMGQAADVRSVFGLTGSELTILAETIPEIKVNAIGTYSNRIHIDTRGYPARWKIIDSIPRQ